MKRTILTIMLLYFGIVFAQFAESPQYEFNSTSSIKYTEYKHQYTIPVSEIQQPFYTPNQQQPRGIRKAPGYDPANPGWETVPVGNPDAYVILVLMLSYFIFNYAKQRREVR